MADFQCGLSSGPTGGAHRSGPSLVVLGRAAGGGSESSGCDDIVDGRSEPRPDDRRSRNSESVPGPGLTESPGCVLGSAFATVIFRITLGGVGSHWMPGPFGPVIT